MYSFLTDIRHDDWLTCTKRTDRPNKLCCKFSIYQDLTHIVNLYIWVSDCDSHSPLISLIVLRSESLKLSLYKFPMMFIYVIFNLSAFANAPEFCA